MSSVTRIKQAFVFSAALSVGALAFASDCGEAPVAPELVDGATVTMEEIVSNSEGVKAYIAEADKYLDCRESIIPTEAFTNLDETAQADYRAANKVVLDARNGIGDAFNAEVAAFKKANP